MAKDGSYLITLYNQQISGSHGLDRSSKYLEQEADEPVINPSLSPKSSPSPAHACTGFSCIIIAKALRKDDGSYEAPVPLWQDPDVTCGLPAVHLDAVRKPWSYIMTVQPILCTPLPVYKTASQRCLKLITRQITFGR